MMIALDEPIRFEGGMIRLLTPADAHSGYVNGLNDPEVNRFLDGVRRTTQTEGGVIEFIRTNQLASDAVFVGIWQNGSDRHCGTIRLHGIEHHHHTAHIGICIFDRNAWGKGLGTKAITAFTKWAIAEFGLRWIEAGAYEQNVASQNTFLSAGYEWVFDIPGKFLFEGRPSLVKVFTARGSGSV
jgi:RimJ/RimL family protein N-acetyltransferase